jgi:hypothetical protein
MGRDFKFQVEQSGSDRCLERRLTLFTRPSQTAFETPAQELEALLAVGIHDSGLLRMQCQPRLRHPFPHFLQSLAGLGLSAAQNDSRPKGDSPPDLL